MKLNPIDLTHSAPKRGEIDPESLQPMSKGPSLGRRMVENASRFGQGLFTATRAATGAIINLFSRMGDLFTNKQDRLIQALEAQGMTDKAMDILKSMGPQEVSSALSTFFQKHPDQLEQGFLNQLFQSYSNLFPAWDPKQLSLSITLDTTQNVNIFQPNILNLIKKDEEGAIDAWTAAQLFDANYHLIPSPSMTIKLTYQDSKTQIESITRNHALLAVKEIAKMGLDAFQQDKVKNHKLTPQGAYAVLLEALVSPDILGDKYEETLKGLMNIYNPEGNSLTLPIVKSYQYQDQLFEKGSFTSINLN